MGALGKRQRRGLTEAMITDSLETVFNSIGRFAQAYRDPAEFGLDYALVLRLLPDADLEALAQRSFAFPILEGWHSGSDLSILDPADPRDRRALLAADHATPAPPAGSTVALSGTWGWPTGSGAATRPSCGRPRSGCSTRARTGTWCCTR